MLPVDLENLFISPANCALRHLSQDNDQSDSFNKRILLDYLISFFDFMGTCSYSQKSLVEQMFKVHDDNSKSFIELLSKII
jgi:hypothetical protein